MKSKEILKILEDKIKILQDLYDKAENNPGEQAIISSKIMKLSKDLELWKDFYKSVEF